MLTVVVIFVVVVVVLGLIGAAQTASPSPPAASQSSSPPVSTPTPRRRKTFEIVAPSATGRLPEPAVDLSMPGPRTSGGFQPVGAVSLPGHCPFCQTRGQVKPRSANTWQCGCCGHHW